MKLDCPMYSDQTDKIWSLKILVMLRCTSRTSLHAVHYKSQPVDVSNGSPEIRTHSV